MKWHMKRGDFPELYREVYVLLIDGSIQKDQAIKVKYGDCEWCEWQNYADLCIVGWSYSY